MNKFYLLLMFISTTVLAQSQPGYYVTKNGQTVNGFFKNSDFLDPESLQFSETYDGNFSKVSVENIVEYGIGKEYRLRKANVNIDRSNTSTSKASYAKEPDWVKKTVFLNILVQGKATLYSYFSEWGTKYFYGLTDNEAVQLIYKPYSPNQSVMMYNNGYKSQLYTELKCDGQKMSDFTDVRYNARSLQNVVKKYNDCNNSESITYSNSTGNKARFKWRVFASGQLTSFNLKNAETEVPSSTETNFGGGLEAAFELGSRKFEIFARVEYEKLSGEASSQTIRVYNVTNSVYDLDASAVNVTVGPRYKFAKFGKHILSIDASAGFSSASGKVTQYNTNVPNGGVAYDAGTTYYDLENTLMIELGLGYTFNDKFGVMGRYTMPRNFFANNNAILEPNIGRVSLNLIYTLN